MYSEDHFCTMDGTLMEYVPGVARPRLNQTMILCTNKSGTSSSSIGTVEHLHRSQLTRYGDKFYAVAFVSVQLRNEEGNSFQVLVRTTTGAGRPSYRCPVFSAPKTSFPLACFVQVLTNQSSCCGVENGKVVQQEAQKADRPQTAGPQFKFLSQ